MQVNNLGRLLKDTGAIGDEREYLEPRLLGNVGGHPLYDTQFMEDGAVVVTKMGCPLFVPISQKRALQRCIKEAEKNVTEVETKQMSGSAYQNWLKRKEAQLRALEDGTKILERTDPQKAADQREDFKKRMEEMEQRMKDQEPVELAQDATNPEQRARTTEGGHGRTCCPYHRMNDPHPPM